MLAGDIIIIVGLLKEFTRTILVAFGLLAVLGVLLPIGILVYYLQTIRKDRHDDN